MKKRRKRLVALGATSVVAVLLAAFVWESVLKSYSYRKKLTDRVS